MINLYFLIGIIISLSIGVVLGYLARQSIAKRQAGTIEAKINKLISNAKIQAKETLSKAKEQADKILEEAKNQQREIQIRLANVQERLTRKEQNIERKNRELEREYEKLKEKAKQIKIIRSEIENYKNEEIKKLEKISGLSKEQAKEELINNIEKEYKQVLLERIKKLEEEGKEELNKRAQKIIAFAIQRISAPSASELTSTTVSLPDEDLKGRIIGKEGRNIKTFEKLTGVELLIDDTPGAVTLSCFDPVRRQIAKIALERLLADGRIQPARIEETVEIARQEVSQKIQEEGEKAVYEAGVLGLDPRLIKILGRLYFRTSYGQNVLYHSVEVAHLASAIASELKADVEVARKAGLLHDIGKALDHEIQGSHVEIGRRILKKFNIEEEVIKAMQAHHEEYPFETIESVIVHVADKISGARPGARKDTLEAYLKRLQELEDIASSFEGVEKAYAIQAGREVRVFVSPEKVDDLGAYKLAKEIANRIHEELRYPGEIKINVIRETRIIEYAR